MKTCAFIIISSVTLLLCFQKGTFIIRKVLRIRVSHNHLEEDSGGKQMAFIFIGGGGGGTSSWQKLFCVDSGLSYEMTQSEQGAFHGAEARIILSLFSVNLLRLENFHFSSSLKANQSVWQLACRSVLSCSGGVRENMETLATSCVQSL